MRTLATIVMLSMIFAADDSVNTNGDANRRLVHKILNDATEAAIFEKWNEKFDLNKCLKFVEDKSCKEPKPCDCPENKGKPECIVKKCDEEFQVGKFDKTSPCYVCLKKPVPEQYKEICEPVEKKCTDLNVNEIANLTGEALVNWKKLCEEHKKDCTILIEKKMLPDSEKSKCCNEKMKKLFPNFFEKSCKDPETCKQADCRTCLEKAADAEKAGKKLEDPACLKEICIAGDMVLVRKVGDAAFNEDCEEFHKDCSDREWKKDPKKCPTDCKKDLNTFLLNKVNCKVDCTDPKYKGDEKCKEEPVPEDKCKHVYYLMKEVVTLAKQGTIDKDAVKKTLNTELCEKDIFLKDSTEYEKKCSEVALADLKKEGALSEEEFKSKLADLKSNGFLQNGNKLVREKKVKAKTLLA